MSFETGTASDYLDLLNKLKLFLTGANSPTSGLSWTVLKENSTFNSPINQIPDGSGLIDVAASNDVAHTEIIFRGTGGVSPEQNLFFGIQTLGLVSTGYFNWQIRGFTGFLDTSPETFFGSQPGMSPPAYVPLQNTTMTYWFVGNDRHVKGVVKTAVSYQSFYIGFLNTFATSVEYPYPMVVAGTAELENRIFSQNAINLSSSILNGGGNSIVTIPPGDAFPTNEASGWVRFTDGNWYGLKNMRAQGAIEARQTLGNGIAHVWPLGETAASLPADENQIVSGDSWALDHMNTTPGGTPNKTLLPSPGSPQLSTLWPLTVHLIEANQILGEFDGLYWITATGGITSEDTITDFGESPEVIHTIFQNVWRTDPWLFFAMRHEA